MTDSARISRRGLLGAGAAGVVVGTLGPAPTASAADSRRKHRKKGKVNLYSRARFAQQRKARFRLTGAAGTTVVTLTRISDLPSSKAGDNGCFALTFRAAKTGPPQGTYSLRRRGFRATTLFVVPDTRRRTYVAVVNRVP